MQVSLYIDYNVIYSGSDDDDDYDASTLMMIIIYARVLS